VEALLQNYYYAMLSAGSAGSRDCDLTKQIQRDKCMHSTRLENDSDLSGQDDPLKLDVLLMHEDLPAGLRGKLALDQVAGHLELEAKFCLHIWNFKLLKEPRLRKLALDDACEANILILAVRGNAGLPLSVRTWLKQWLQTRFDAPCALVVSLDVNARDVSPPHSLLRYARAIAAPAGVDFFPHYSDTPPAPWRAQTAQRIDLATWGIQ
jgi:hypothetical protein